MPTTVFWPDDVICAGFCYGWLEPAVCVAGVLQLPSKQHAETALESLCGAPEWLSVAETCGSKPCILGTCDALSDQALTPSLDLGPTVKDYTLIYYHRHNPVSLRFYSLDLLRLGFGGTGRRKTSSIFQESLGYDFTLARAAKAPSGLNPVAVNQFNAARTIELLICKADSRRSLPPRLSHYLWDLMEYMSVVFLQTLFWVSRPLPSLCNAHISLFSRSTALKDIFATVQQIDVRAEQADFLSSEIRPLYQHSTMPVAVVSARYTNFFNTVWLILNDITIGIAFGSFLCDNHIVLSELLVFTVENILINWIQWALKWLDSWPAGLKLNTELSRFYSHTFIDLIAMWGRFLHRGVPYWPDMIYVFGILSCGGMTIAISLILDLLALLTAHIYVGYFISNAVYERLLKTAGSLWNLFRGKRFNVLRNRTDSWEYDTDQLLFGTILFTLLAFLFPTVLAYYALFAMMRLATILLNATLEMQLAFMNHFPLFALMLRAKDPWRLPGGIYFNVKSFPQSLQPVLVVESQPVPFSSIFFQYIQLWSRLSSHYNPLRLLYCMLKGEFLTSIPRYSMRYTKIPEGEALRN